MTNVSPIALFVYARPEHTQRTLAALQSNPEASQSHLYVFCDGPRESDSAEQREKIRQTREVVASRKWCGKVSIVEAEENLGLAKSIVTGVTSVCDRHQRVIVLEDVGRPIDLISGRVDLRAIAVGDALPVASEPRRQVHEGRQHRVVGPGLLGAERLGIGAGR